MKANRPIIMKIGFLYMFVCSSWYFLTIKDVYEMQVSISPL